MERSTLGILLQISTLLYNYSPKNQTNEYLKQTAGEEVIEVENRSKKLQINEKDSEFGLSAPQEKIKFEELLTKIEEKNENYYLTTQHIEEGKFGFTSIFAPPVYSLRKNFPLTPLLLGNLSSSFRIISFIYLMNYCFDIIYNSFYNYSLFIVL